MRIITLWHDYSIFVKYLLINFIEANLHTKLCSQVLTDVYIKASTATIKIKFSVSPKVLLDPHEINPIYNPVPVNH